MERLNDIMMRSPQRRQPPDAEQRRPASQPLARRPLPEQRRSQYQQRPPRQPQQRGETYNPPRRGFRQPAYDGDAAPTEGYREPVPSQRLPRYPLDEQHQAEAQRREARPSGDYYESYSLAPEADVQQWEDDGAGMVYGDWEGEDIVDPSPYAQRQQERDAGAPRGTYDYQSTAGAFASQNRGSLATRQLARMEEREIETQPPAPRSPLAPQVRIQRNTQPLNPRRIARMGQGLPQPPSPSQEPPRIQQPTRQVVLHTPTQAQAVPSVSQPATLPRPLGGKSVCPKCRGAGYLREDVPFGHPRFGKPIPCECKEAEKMEKRRQELLELSDLSAFQNKSFENFNPRFAGVHPSVQEAFRAALTFAQEPEGWLLLVGPNGCGKTHLAAAIANHYFYHGVVVLFSVVPDLLAHLRATFAPSATEAYDQRFAKMREAQLLVLDDLGAHQSSSWASEKLFQLLNYRYNWGLPTVITANGQGLATVDERIRSRLSDTALVTRVEMSGALDYRQRNPRR